MRGMDLENVWGDAGCRTVVLRGADSHVLGAETVREMKRRKSYLEVVGFQGVGHAPALTSDEQIEVERCFLLQS